MAKAKKRQVQSNRFNENFATATINLKELNELKFIKMHESEQYNVGVEGKASKSKENSRKKKHN